MKWIVIPKWDGPQGFQHYKDRNPKWIKVYVELMSDDEFMTLSFADRGLLVSIWLEYASARRALAGDTLSLSRRLGQRVTRAQVERLVHAGFIEFSASKPGAKPYENARPEQEVREIQEALDVVRDEPPEQESINGLSRLVGAGERYFAQVALMPLITDAKEDTWDLVGRLSSRLPVSVLHSLKETLESRGDIASPAGYVVGTLKAELEQRKVPA